MSQPPCELDVSRIVMTEEILVSSAIFDTIKSKVTDGFGPSNHRPPVNEGAGTVGANYKMYRHIDQSNKIMCSTSKIMEKYIDKDINSILTEKQKIDYEKLIKEAQNVQDKYTNIFNKLNVKQINTTTEKKISNSEIQYNYLAKLSTDISHIHKIPMSMARKLFLTQ